jgi:hypothetical protein
MDVPSVVTCRSVVEIDSVIEAVAHYPLTAMSQAEHQVPWISRGMRELGGVCLPHAMLRGFSA